MTQCYTIQRQSQRIQLDVRVRLQRHDGTLADGTCLDASEQGFGITADMPLELGEIVRLTIGRADRGPSFTAQVVWRDGCRIGLYCVASND